MTPDIFPLNGTEADSPVTCNRCGGATVQYTGLSRCRDCQWWTYWPPVGDYAVVWEKFESVSKTFTDAEKSLLAAVLNRWVSENSTLMAYTDENGEWVNIKWPWTEDS